MGEGHSKYTAEVQQYSELRRRYEVLFPGESNDSPTAIRATLQSNRGAYLKREVNPTCCTGEMTPKEPDNSLIPELSVVPLSDVESGSSAKVAGNNAASSMSETSGQESSCQDSHSLATPVGDKSTDHAMKDSGFLDIEGQELQRRSATSPPIAASARSSLSDSNNLELNIDTADLEVASTQQSPRDAFLASNEMSLDLFVDSKPLFEASADEASPRLEEGSNVSSPAANVRRKIYARTRAATSVGSTPSPELSKRSSRSSSVLSVDGSIDLDCLLPTLDLEVRVGFYLYWRFLYRKILPIY